MRIKITKNKEIYNFCEPYIIAELGSNHNGDLQLAKKLIKTAKEVGADCVKFQSWTKNTIFSKIKYQENYFLNDDYRNRNDYSLEQIVEEFSISEDELYQMKKYSDEVGIDCTSTPFSKSEVDFLVDVIKAPFVKIASMDLNNYPFLSYIAKKNKPIMLSTGLSELYEIDKAIETIEKEGNSQIILLHCISVYPPEDIQVNLNIIDTLHKLYPYPIGFSDHTIGVPISIASVVKGVCVIEKHFTLDKNMFGWDHKISADVDELKSIIDNSKRVHKALGSFRIKSVEDESKKKEFRRSIVTTKSFKKGHILKEKDIDFKRPGIGIKPEESKYVIGRTLKKDLSEDQIIKWSDLI